MQSFVKIKSSQNGEITLLITDIGKSCSSREFLSRKFVLFVLLLYVPSQQLWSLRDGQLT